MGLIYTLLYNGSFFTFIQEHNAGINIYATFFVIQYGTQYFAGMLARSAIRLLPSATLDNLFSTYDRK